MIRTKEVNKGGAPLTQWNNKRCDQAFRLALLGATDSEMADVMGININTLDLWKRTHLDFMEALTAGKMEADSHVAHSLYKKACGFEYQEEQVAIHKGVVIRATVQKKSVPDAWAAVKWLELRQRAKWTSVQRTEITQTNLNINSFDFSGLDTQELIIVKQIQGKQNLSLQAPENDGR